MIVDPKILSIKEEVIYPWEIAIAINRITDVQERKLAKAKKTMRLKTVLERMEEGMTEDNSCSFKNSSE